MDNYSKRRKRRLFFLPLPSFSMVLLIVKWQCTGMVNCINQWKSNHFSRSNHFNDNNWRYYNSFGWSYLREMESNGEEGKANGNTIYIFRNNIYLCVLCCSHTTYPLSSIIEASLLSMTHANMTSLIYPSYKLNMLSQVIAMIFINRNIAYCYWCRYFLFYQKKCWYCLNKNKI